MSRMVIWASLAGVVALAGCDPAPKANATGPKDACLRLMSAAAGAAGAKVVVYDEPNLETCAVHIEGVRLTEHRDSLVGLWNGVYIFADSHDIVSGATPTAPRYSIFSADQRRQIDQSLTEQLAAKAAAASGKPAAP